MPISLTDDITAGPSRYTPANRRPSWSKLRPACNTAGARHPNNADRHRGGGRLVSSTSIVVTLRLEVGEKAKRPAR